MNSQTEDAVVRYAAQLYSAWESRPWYIKVWDRVRSECGYALYLLGHLLRDLQDSLGLYMVHVYRINSSSRLHRLPAPLAWLECKVRPSAQLWFTRRWTWN